jgi:hypothetical protein
MEHPTRPRDPLHILGETRLCPETNFKRLLKTRPLSRRCGLFPSQAAFIFISSDRCFQFIDVGTDIDVDASLAQRLRQPLSRFADDLGESSLLGLP